MKAVFSIPVTAAVAVWMVCPGRLPAQGKPSVDIVKQVLDKKLQGLKPQGISDRNILFQDIKAGRPEASSYPFRVTVVIRDYEPGYPANRYYGNTCVFRMEEEYTAEPDRFGGWDVHGRLTPHRDESRCEKNTAAGVSSIPLSSLTGTAAPVGKVAAAPAPIQPAGAVAQGAYECWGNGRPRLMLNFKVSGGNQYMGESGKVGRFSFDPATQAIAFRGGSLDGVMPKGFTSIYHVPQGKPTVSFRGPNGEAAYCEKR